MKQVLVTLIFVLAGMCLCAQKDTFDLVAYIPPKDPTGISWQKEVKENTTSYTMVNKKDKIWCQINIVKSVISKGDIEQDFDSEWKELVVKSYKPTETPQLNEVVEAEGWKIKAGAVKFTFGSNDAMALLTTATGYNRCASIVATTNSEHYLNDIMALIASVDLQKPATVTEQAPTINNNNDNSIIGTWKSDATDYSDFRVKNGVMSTISRQYTFNADGSYSFVSKAYDPLMSSMLLGKENGTYQINGKNITISPKKSVLQAWSKKNGTSEWGALINTQNRPLEKVTYRLTKYYFTGIESWNVVLQADKATQRDGPNSNSNTFENAWYYKPVSENNPIIKLPGN